MADHSKPTTTSTYVNFVSELDGRLDDLALGLDPATTTPTNVPTNAIRWTSAGNKWEKWNGTSWGDLSSGYAIPISGASVAATTLTASGNVTLGDAAGDTITLNGTVQPGVVVSGSSSGDALRITQTGTGNALVVEDSASPDSTPVVIDAVGKLIVGNTTTLPPGESWPLQVQSTSSAGIGLARFSNDLAAPLVSLVKSRNTTLGSYGTSVVAGDYVGQIVFSGDDGTNRISTASINAIVDGTPATSSMPGRLVFNTTASGSSAPTERMRINSSGQVLIGTASDALVNAYDLQVTNTDGAGILTQRYAGESFGGAFMRMDKSRGATVGARASVVANDTLGTLEFRGDDSTSFVVGAAIAAGVDGTPGTGAMPGRLVFSTTPSGSSSPVEAMRITSGQGIQITRTAVTAPAAADGNVFSGIYVPTLTAQTNVAASIAYTLFYTRVGDVVTLAGRVAVAAAAVGATVLRISPPVATNFTSTTQCGGVGVSTTITQDIPASVYADITNDELVFAVDSQTTATVSYTLHCTYRVI